MNKIIVHFMMNIQTKQLDFWRSGWDKIQHFFILFRFERLFYLKHSSLYILTPSNNLLAFIEMLNVFAGFYLYFLAMTRILHYLQEPSSCPQYSHMLCVFLIICDRYLLTLRFDFDTICGGSKKIIL